MKQLLGILLTLAVFAAVALVGLALAFVLLGVAAAGWVYMKVTGKHPLENFFTQSVQTPPSHSEHSEIIEAEYKVIE